MNRIQILNISFDLGQKGIFSVGVHIDILMIVEYIYEIGF